MKVTDEFKEAPQESPVSAGFFICRRQNRCTRLRPICSSNFTLDASTLTSKGRTFTSNRQKRQKKRPESADSAFHFGEREAQAKILQLLDVISVEVAANRQDAHSTTKSWEFAQMSSCCKLKLIRCAPKCVVASAALNGASEIARPRSTALKRNREGFAANSNTASHHSSTK